MDRIGDVRLICLLVKLGDGGAIGDDMGGLAPLRVARWRGRLRVL